MTEHDGMVCLDRGIRQRLVRAIIENHTVGEHLHHGTAIVQSGCRHDFLVQLQFHIQAAGKEGSLGAQHQATRVERVFHGAVRRGLGNGAELGSRRILSLRKTVDLVIEQDDVDVDIAPDGVNEVVAADGKGIAVAAGLPYGQPGIGHLDAGRYGRCTAVDAMEPIRIHIIRKAGGTSDSGHHHVAFLLVVQGGTHLRESALQSSQHGMVPASGAPADFLVRLKILE